MDLSELREDYTKAGLLESDVASDPFTQFERWFREAEAAKLDEPNAMCLATADPDGQPSTRVVLLKDFSPRGLTFYTNYESRKSAELTANPKAGANFLWLALQRQVNIIGSVERIGKAESLKYFLSRPLGSRLGAWTSPQSKIISSRQILESKLEQMKKKFADGEVPLPDHWGGYRIVPDSFEFWQGRPSRLHDRIKYRRSDSDAWDLERLAP
ncbi:MAG: pyridoxamine 5'-phosphate oxidase [Verrucomicrobiota bacterium]